MKDTIFCDTFSLNFNGKLKEFKSPTVMGILNVTPDSFFDGNKYKNEHSILNRAEQILNEGATFVDIGGYSSKPGANEISEKEESTRVCNAIELIIKEFPETIISIDTFRSNIAQNAINCGALMINDISAAELDSKMPEVVIKNNVPYIIMHMQGTPQTMQKKPQYLNPSDDVFKYLVNKVDSLKKEGVIDLIIDPGFGFGKSVEHNYDILNKLEIYKYIDAPILVGFSRKSMIYKLLENTPNEALNGTTTCNTIALTKGAKILRVHDVKEAVECVKITNMLSC